MIDLAFCERFCQNLTMRRITLTLLPAWPAMGQASLNRLKKLGRAMGVALSLATVAASAQAPLDVRVALVIGNAAYAGNAALVNPANDARAMASALTQLGFTVIELRDGNKSEISAAVAKAREALKGKQGVGMLYYAGHGLQLDWRNYMVPVDARLGSSADVATQTVDVNTVLEAFKGAGNRNVDLAVETKTSLADDESRSPKLEAGTAARRPACHQPAPNRTGDKLISSQVPALESATLTKKLKY